MFKAIFLEFCRIYQFLLSRNSCLHLFCPGWDIPSPYLLSFPIACLSKKSDHMAPLLQRLDWFGCVCSDYKVTPMSAYRNGCLAIILLLALHKMSILCLALPLSSWPCSKISELIILYQPSLFQLLKWTSCTFRISHGIYSPVSNALPQSHFT